jgi:hypothetical protein
VKEEFIPPVTFELVLRHKRKEALKKVVKWLLHPDSGGTHPFQWEMIMLETTIEYQLSIQSSWAFNLVQIGEILMKYQDKTR